MSAWGEGRELRCASAPHRVNVDVEEEERERLLRCVVKPRPIAGVTRGRRDERSSITIREGVLLVATLLLISL